MILITMIMKMQLLAGRSSIIVVLMKLRSESEAFSTPKSAW